jgi:cell division protein FtsB
MKRFLSKLWKIVKNKYVAATLIFLLFFLFLGENNVRVIHRLKHELNDLNKEASLIEENIHQDSLEAVSLFGSKEALEAYGREHYYMKRDDEDIYIIKDEK